MIGHQGHLVFCARVCRFLDVYLKDFFAVEHVRTVWGFAPRLPHESDGLIFTPVLQPYVGGPRLVHALSYS